MRTIVAAIVVLSIAIGGWTALWVAAAHEAGSQTDAWITSEAAQGRQWTCPDRAMGGYPFALTISCRDASFLGEALGQRVRASLAHVTAEASLMHPRRVALTLQPPFAYRSSDGATDLQGQWTSLHVDLDGLPDIANVALNGTDVVLDGAFGPAGQQHLQSVRLDAVVGTPTHEADPTVAFDIAVAGTDIPALDALVGDTQPTDLHLVGRLDQAAVGDARTPEEAMDRWRRAGGHVDLTKSEVVRVGSRVSATGTLRLDAAHRPQGRLEAEFIGLEPILKRYGINANLAAAGALLDTLFGSGPQHAPPPHAGTITLPISLQDGHLGIGPIRTDILIPPLY